MSRSLLTLALFLVPTTALAGTLPADEATPSSLGADPTAVAERGSDEKEGKKGKQGAARKSSGKKRSGGEPKRDAGEKRDGGNGGDEKAERGEQRDERGGAHAPDPYRAQPDRAQPDRTQGARAQPARDVDGATGRGQPTTRHIATAPDGSARAQSPGATRRSASPAPANFRGSPTQASHTRAQASARGGGHEAASRHQPAARAEHARATARGHHEAAASRRHHDTVSAHHRAYAARHAPPSRWYAPRSWFRPYYPAGPRYWYHGTFVYGPSPWYGHPHHVVVVEGDGARSGPKAEREDSGPERKVDRGGTFALGVRGGSYMGSYNNGSYYGDAGIGLAARYRPVEAVGLELSWQHHDQTWDTGSERVHQPVQLSVEAFAFPWSKVNPYALAGVTYTSRAVQDEVAGRTVESAGALWGPHAGVGLELGVGKKASLNFDVRWVGYLNKSEADPTTPGAATANMGVNFYF